MATVNPDERNQAEPLRVCGGSTLMRQGTDACGKSRKTTNISENARMKQRSPVRFHSNTKHWGAWSTLEDLGRAKGVSRVGVANDVYWA